MKPHTVKHSPVLRAVFQLMVICSEGRNYLLREIGTDHIRIELNPRAGLFRHTFIIDQKLEEKGFEIRSDHAGADLVLRALKPSSLLASGEMIGGSVIELKEGDIFSEEGIQSRIISRTCQ